MKIYIVEERHTTMYMPLAYYRTKSSAVARFGLIVHELQSDPSNPPVNLEPASSDKGNLSLIAIVRCGHEIYRLREVETED